MLFTILLTSCSQPIPKNSFEANDSGSICGAPNNSSSIVITLNDSISNGTVVLDGNVDAKDLAGTLKNKSEIVPTPNETLSSNMTNTSTAFANRVSEVEFYFFIKDKVYFRRIMAENEIRNFSISSASNISDSISNYTSNYIIEPLIITLDSVKFRINDYISKTLREHESDSTPDFEIIVSHIYYRR